MTRASSSQDRRGAELPPVHLGAIGRRGVPRRRLRLHGLAGLAVVLCGLACSGCTGGGDRTVIRASGHIEATEVKISTKVGGTLLSLARGEGDRVEAGAELARLDTVDLSLTLAAARADRDQAAAELRLRLAGFRPDEIREAEAQLARAQAELEGAERDLARMQALLDSGSGTEKARDDARTRRDLAAAARDVVREQLNRRRAGFRAEEIEAARARHAAASARVAQVEQQLRDTRIESPLGGIVTQKLADPGELLPAGAPLCVVTDLDRPWLTAYIGEPDLGRVRLGQQAEVVTDAGESRTGRLTFVSDRAEFTPRNVQTREERVKLVYQVKITLDNQDGLFKTGMPAEARLRISGE